MAKARAIVKQRKSVQNIRKITRTMQLIATSRFQSAMQRANRSKAYMEQFLSVVQRLSRAEPIRHPLLEPHPESKRSVLIVLTGNRGLCGAYNISILREAEGQIAIREQKGQEIELIVSGRKGIRHFEFEGRTLATGLTVFEHQPQFVAVEPIATAVMDAYTRQRVDSAHVTYMHFETASQQVVRTIQLLPLQHPPQEEQEQLDTKLVTEYDVIPPPAELLGDLLPQGVKLQLFQCFIHAAVSEQVARMIAMKSATESAGNMIRKLTQQYNRARQSQITLELLDIMGGAEALK